MPINLYIYCHEGVCRSCSCHWYLLLLFLLFLLSPIICKYHHSPSVGWSIPHLVAPAIWCFIRKLSSLLGIEPTTITPKSGVVRPLSHDWSWKQTLLDLCWTSVLPIWIWMCGSTWMPQSGLNQVLYTPD